MGIALWKAKTHVVAVEGVGNNENGRGLAIGASHRRVKRNIVAVVVAVVFKAALIGHKAFGVWAVAPGVPAQGSLTAGTRNVNNA